MVHDEVSSALIGKDGEYAPIIPIGAMDRARPGPSALGVRMVHPARSGPIPILCADVAELVDALDLGSSGATRAGSIPVIRIFDVFDICGEGCRNKGQGNKDRSRNAY